MNVGFIYDPYRRKGPVTALFFLGGLILLLGGAHLLVSASSSLAVRSGIPPVFIGITVVAFATSAPEIAVSLDAAFDMRPGLALGNVIGSNIANILLIVGLSAVIAPIKIRERIIWFDVPIMIVISATTYLLALDRNLSPIDGGLLLLLFAGFIIFQISQARKEKGNREMDESADLKKGSLIKQVIFMALGIGLLILGARWLVGSSIHIARFWELSELVIGLTIIALGTSLPELATSAVAAWNKEPDISVGNIVGSNIFNLLLVLGLSAILSSGGLSVSEAALSLDLPLLIAVSLACLPIFFTGHKISRWEGYVFLGYYAAYLLYLFLDSTQHQMLPIFNEVMVLFVAPITVFILIIFAVRYRKKP